MAASIATRPPDSIYVGDSATWSISLSDYPAGDGWTLTYQIIQISGGTQYTFAATADGDAHLVELTAATTAGWLPGEYRGQAYVSLSGEVHTVWSGTIQILPDLATQQGVDLRTTARKMLDGIEAGLLAVHMQLAAGNRITEWTAEGLHVKKNDTNLLIAELIKQRNYWKTIVMKEEADALVGQGRGTGRRILIHFVPPT